MKDQVRAMTNTKIDNYGSKVIKCPKCGCTKVYPIGDEYYCSNCKHQFNV